METIGSAFSKAAAGYLAAIVPAHEGGYINDPAPTERANACTRATCAGSIRRKSPRATVCNPGMR